ncbi:hypothetical protein NUSPORA_00101 [Nucleospora cyclopteri]
MDEILKKLLDEHKEIETKIDNLAIKCNKIVSHKRTLVKAQTGTDIIFYVCPKLETSKPNQDVLAEQIRSFKPYNYSLIILNNPNLSQQKFIPQNSSHRVILFNCVNYKGIRVFQKSKLSTSGNTLEVYKSYVYKRENNVFLEIVDSENIIWTSFDEFQNSFDFFPFTLSSWLGI